MYLTSTDQRLLPLALREKGQFHNACEWYFKGWSPLSYQWAFHHLQQKNVTWKAGIGTGKTTTIAASVIMDCITLPEFRALSTSVTAKQAELTYAMFLQWMERNPNLEHHIKDMTRRPWPVIKFMNYSEWEIRTAGMNGANIRGSEYDRATFDEPELDPHGEIVGVLRGRLRGKRGKQFRMARMDLTGTPSDALWWIDRFKRGMPGTEVTDMEHYCSMLTTTYENTHLAREQIKLMEAEYSDEQIEVEMNGKDPDYGSSFLPKSHIDSCTSQAINDLIYDALYPESGIVKPGYALEEHPRHGIMRLEMPYNPKSVYVMAGDPGTDGPPKRNSAVVAVLDASQRPARLVYFHWIDGHGSYKPFMQSYAYAFAKYRPFVKFCDTTGTQKAIGELGFESYGIEVDDMNFSTDKWAAMNSLSMTVTNHEILMPVSKGIIRQLSSYSKQMDDDKSFPQDITMTFAMLAFALRHVNQEREEDDREETYSRPNMRNRHTGRSSHAHSRR